MPNRIDEVGGEWAKDAPNVSGTPNPGSTYANTLINEAVINKAWPFSEIVASNNFNEIMRRMTRLMIQLEQQGILSYSALTDYGIGALVLGNNDILYKSLIANGPDSVLKDPTNNPDYWRDAGTGGVTSILADGLAVVTPDPIKDEGTIDVPVATIIEAEEGGVNDKAMTPLRTRQAIAASPKATVAVRGVVEKSTDLENTEGTAVDVYPDVAGIKDMIDEHAAGDVSLLKEQNLSDVADAAISFTNIKQIATITSTGVVEKSTDLENTEGTAVDVYPDVVGVKKMIDTHSPEGSANLWTESGTSVYRPLGNVGIGTDDPQAKLEVAGQVKITGGDPGEGKVLTSDAAGKGTWKNPEAGGGGGGSLLNVQYFTSSGTWIKSADTAFIKVTISGGGGGGCGVSTSASGGRGTSSKFGNHINAFGGGGGNRDSLLVFPAPVTFDDIIVSGTAVYGYVNDGHIGGRSLLSDYQRTAEETGSSYGGGGSGIKLVEWTKHDTPAARWRDITYGDGIWVCVAEAKPSGEIMSSPDGINWTIHPAPGAYLWIAVSHGNGMFVAVAKSGSGGEYVMTSPTGVTWTSRTPSPNIPWNNITYGNGLFVAVGTSVMTSPDGITWTSGSDATSGNPSDNLNAGPWFDITYGDGLFVAVGSAEGNSVATSPDGIIWTNQQVPMPLDYRHIVYGNGVYVALSINGIGNRVMTSPNGIDWVSHSGIPDHDWQGLAYGDGTFIAVTYYATNTWVMKSLDGIIWEPTNKVYASYRNIAFGNGLFITVFRSFEYGVYVYPMKEITRGIRGGGGGGGGGGGVFYISSGLGNTEEIVVGSGGAGEDVGGDGADGVVIVESFA